MSKEKERCSRCSGGGEITCPGCGGDGKLVSVNEEKGERSSRIVNCSGCNGSGVRTCGSCGGSGEK
jgi:DnaJ-class molecular chaperone